VALFKFLWTTLTSENCTHNAEEQVLFEECLEPFIACTLVSLLLSESKDKNIYRFIILGVLCEMKPCLTYCGKNIE